MFDIKTEIKLYRIREIAIEDLKLRIEEISKGNNFNEIGYDEKFQSSKSCPNNDKDMNDIERLTKKIKSMKIANKRVDNALKLIDGTELEVVTRLFIKSESASKVAKSLDRTAKHVEKIARNAINEIEESFKIIRDDSEKRSILMLQNCSKNAPNTLQKCTK